MRKIILMAVVAVCGFFATGCENEKVIGFGDLPATAQSFITSHWGDMVVTFVQKDGGVSTEYTVQMANLDEIEFDKKGVWESVDCTNGASPRAVPSGIATEKINALMAASYADYLLVGIDSENGYYELEVWKAGLLEPIDGIMVSK